MELSREAKIVCGLLLLAVPSIGYGGTTLLGLLTEGAAGTAPGGLELTERQFALWRAGHAHAGVFLILSLILQVLIDQISFSQLLTWLARLGAPCGAILAPAGFFGLAFGDGFRWVLYGGIVCLLVSLLITGIGLIAASKGEKA